MSPKKAQRKGSTRKSGATQPFGGDGYSVGTWMGQPQYVCDSCPYDTLHEAVIKKHVAGHSSMPARAALEPKLQEEEDAKED